MKLQTPEKRGRLIRAYLEKHDLTQAQFADHIGVSPGMVSVWARGLEITPDRAATIEQVTSGEIKAIDLIFARGS